jgi:putative transposase
VDEKQSLSHTKWEYKYHLVWIPKYRKKELYTELWRYLGPWFRDLAFQKESQILEGHLKPDHIHMLTSIPPKHSVAQVVWFLKGKSAIQIAWVYLGKRKNFTG